MRTVIILLLATFSVSFAQKNYEWGVKAGILSSVFRGPDFKGLPAGGTSTNFETVSTDAPGVTGYTAGVYVRSLESFFIQAEMFYGQKGAQIDHFTPGGRVTTQVGFSQIDVPLSLGYQNKSFEALGGILLTGTIGDDGSLTAFLKKFANVNFNPYRPFVMGYHLGAAAKYKAFSLNLRYMGGFRPLIDETVFYNDPTVLQGSLQSKFQQRVDSWQITLGYRIK